MKIKFVLIILALWLFTGIAELSAQKQEDVLYLKNGSVIRGEVIKMTDSTFLIQTYEGNIWAFEKKKVESLKQEERLGKTWQITDKRFYNITDVSFMVGRSNFGVNPAFGIQVINGYQINQNYGIGLGTGIEWFQEMLAPVFLETRGYLQGINSDFSFFAAIQIGYSIPLENHKMYDDTWSNQGGFLFNPEIGLKKNFTNNTALNVSAGYRYQETKSKNYYYWWENGSSTTRSYYNRFVLRLGLLFN